MNYSKSQKGFTLIELIIAVSIMGVISCAFFTAAHQNQDVQLKRSAERLLHDLKYLQMCSMFKTDSTTEYMHWLYARPGNNYYVLSERGKPSERVYLERGIKIESMTFQKGSSPQYDIFFTRTGSPSYAGTFVLENRNGKKVKITIVPVTGRIGLFDVE